MKTHAHSNPCPRLGRRSLTWIILILTCLLLAVGCSAFKTALPGAKGRVVLNDPLNGSSLGKVQGGQFVAGGGWTATADNERIVWELPPMPPDGMLEIDIRNFDPPNQVIANNNMILGLWGKLFNNMETKHQADGKGVPDTDGYELRIGKSVRQFKIEYHSRGVGAVKFWEPFVVPFDPKRTYHFKLEWRGGTVTTTLGDYVLVFDKGCDPNDPIDHFNFLHIGTSPIFGGNYTPGPIYSNLKITGFEKQ